MSGIDADADASDCEPADFVPLFDVNVATLVFGSLDAVQDLANCARVSKAWRAVADDDGVWTSLREGHFGSGSRAAEPGCWESRTLQAGVPRIGPHAPLSGLQSGVQQRSWNWICEYCALYFENKQACYRRNGFVVRAFY